MVLNSTKLKCLESVYDRLKLGGSTLKGKWKQINNEEHGQFIAENDKLILAIFLFQTHRRMTALLVTCENWIIICYYNCMLIALIHTCHTIVTNAHLEHIMSFFNRFAKANKADCIRLTSYAEVWRKRMEKKTAIIVENKNLLSDL